ncbi:MAG: type VI secretion system-associated FHA domain protein TagH [Methylosarcina sp.]
MKLYLSIKSAGADREHTFSKTLDHEGATLGRLNDNTLILPDAKKYISGHHAVIKYRTPHYYLTDTSTNGVLMNLSPTPLGHGNSIQLNNGDRIQIGDYTLTVSLIDDYASGADQTLDTGSVPLSNNYPHFSDDPFQEFGSDPIKKTIDDNELIPSGWKEEKDPFDMPSSRPEDSSTESVRQPEPKDFEHIDSFKEALPPLQGRFEQFPGTQPASAPKDIFGEDWYPKTANNKTESSQLPEERTVPPAAASSQNSAAPAFARGRDSPAAGGGRSKAEPAIQQKAKPPSEPLKSHLPGQLEDELVRNFLRGAGLENSLRPETLTGESFYIVGKILRESIQGAKDVLSGRETIKVEMHLDLTRMRPRENNPIKFSVSADEALVKLLTSRDKAYLPPAAAIKEVFDDIRAHQFAVIAGMKTALLSVLKRFDPAKLEHRLQETSPIAASIPIHKQAKLWSLFEHLYHEIGQEAADNFYHLFGQVFAETYEHQVQTIKRSTQDSSFDRL